MPPSKMPQQKSGRKFFLVAFILAGVGLFFYFDGARFLGFDYLKAQRAFFEQTVSDNPFFSAGIFVAIYIVTTALSLPGAAILTLAAGAFFGLGWGTILSSVGSTIGATFAFLSARFVLRDFVEKRFGSSLKRIDAEISRQGAQYLFTLRLVPVFPFFMVNLAMGLTNLKAWTYFWVSMIGMLPGTFVYVNAGTQLGQLESLRGILSLDLIFSFGLLALFPVLVSNALEYWRRTKVYASYKKPKKFDYNLVVIGAGAAGLVSAYIAAAVKARVALIEKHKMGGDCLNTGCVPSKALIRAARLQAEIARAKDFGIEEARGLVDFKKVMQRVHKVIKTIEPHDSVERYTGLGVECINGDAALISPWEVKVGGRVLKSKNIVLATGAEPLVPRIPGLDGIDFYTSDSIWSLETLPERLLILGGGPIGCELAQAFQRLGTQVVQVEQQEGLLMAEDSEVRTFVAEALEADGVRVETSARAVEFKRASGTRSHSGVCIVERKNAGREEISFDACLIAVGRRARTEGFGLRELGIELNSNHFVVVNDYLQTKFPNIYACGDVIGHYLFTHTASHQAWYCAVNALFSPLRKYKVNYEVIPRVTFTEPEVARVGLNEMEANKKTIPYEVVRYDLDDLDRAIADGAAEGFVKVLVRPGSDQILGATIVGHGAGELLSEWVLAMKHRIGLNKLLGTIHAYPTWMEANKYLAGVWKKKHAPERALRLLGRFHAWRRGA